ncbi:MAG: hypothetical protein ACOX3E_14285 [Desulfomonilia bacterium]
MPAILAADPDTPPCESLASEDVSSSAARRRIERHSPAHEIPLPVREGPAQDPAYRLDHITDVHKGVNGSKKRPVHPDGIEQSFDK